MDFNINKLLKTEKLQNNQREVESTESSGSSELNFPNNFKKPKKKFFTKKRIFITTISLAVITAGVFLTVILTGSETKKIDTKQVAMQTLKAVEKVFVFLPIEEDVKKELQVVNELATELTKTDDVTRRYLILLQNNYEIRPGGGFLGQYAVVKVKNGEVQSFTFEDANLLDQRIGAKIPPPYPFRLKLNIKNWKFTNSNFSPDYPTNVEKAKYFYGLSGGNRNFDGVIAINSDVLNHILEITGPIQVPGYSTVFTSEDAAWKLEAIVEDPYLADENLDDRYRKNIIRTMGNIIIEKAFTLGNIPKLVEFAHNELSNKNVQLNFTNEHLQSLVESVHWDGSVAQNWGGDYLMVVDANMGGLKSDYYMRRSIQYDINLTLPEPEVTLTLPYNHTATYTDWANNQGRVSDYHGYLRVYLPAGAEKIENSMVRVMTQPYSEFGKTVYGFWIDAVMNKTTTAIIKYKLPAGIKDDYKLLIQKQSGVGDVPVTINIKSDKGEFHQEAILKKDLKFEIK